MSALFDLVTAICTQPAIELAALTQDGDCAEFARLFGAVCAEMGLAEDEELGA